MRSRVASHGTLLPFCDSRSKLALVAGKGEARGKALREGRVGGSEDLTRSSEVIEDLLAGMGGGETEELLGKVSGRAESPKLTSLNLDSRI